MGGFLGSPWNFIFLDEFAAAGGARISLSSLCGETWKGYTHPTLLNIFLPPVPRHQCLSWLSLYVPRRTWDAAQELPNSLHL